MSRNLLRMLAGVLLGLQVAAAAAAPRPGEVVNDFHAAVGKGDRQGALDLLASDVVIYEQGFSEFNRREYAGDHLAADLAFQQHVKRSITWRQVFEDQAYAFVISEYRIVGRFEGTDVDLKSAETMVLRRSGQDWKIVHIHWSAHTLQD